MAAVAGAVAVEVSDNESSLAFLGGLGTIFRPHVRTVYIQGVQSDITPSSWGHLKTIAHDLFFGPISGNLFFLHNKASKRHFQDLSLSTHPLPLSPPSLPSPPYKVIKGLIRPLRALKSFLGPHKALNCLIRP